MPRLGLDSRQVVAAAGELIDSEGLAALSLSALAGRLGVRSPSLYAHVGGLEDLRRRLAVQAAEQLGETLAPAAAGLSGAEALAAISRAYRCWALEHPGLYATIAAAGQDADPALARVLELIFAVLRGYGLDDDAAVHAARSVRAALHGYISIEAQSGFALPVDPDVSFDWMLATLDAGLAARAA